VEERNMVFDHKSVDPLIPLNGINTFPPEVTDLQERIFSPSRVTVKGPSIRSYVYSLVFPMTKLSCLRIDANWEKHGQSPRQKPRLSLGMVAMEREGMKCLTLHQYFLVLIIKDFVSILRPAHFRW
jgi:hypothetical protein